jgi:hypothetical protein
MTSNHEPGYRPMLVWGHTKIALQEIRQRIATEQPCQERWLITAAAELVLEHPELHAEWLIAVYGMARREEAFEASIGRNETSSTFPGLLGKALEIEMALQEEVRVVRDNIRAVAGRVTAHVKSIPAPD